MTDSPEASEDLSLLFELLDQKQSPECPFQVHQQFYQKGCEFFKQHPSCIWCKFTPIAVEMVHLYSLPPNPFTDLFDKLTSDCLGSCSNCINAYHTECPRLLKRLEEIYEEDALSLFAKTLYAKTTTRLFSVLQGYFNGSIPHNNQKLLYGLFEILEFPLSLGDAVLDGHLSKVMHSLIESRKMLKVTKVMPGVVVLAFHEDSAVRGWAVNVLATKLQPPSRWHPELVGLNDAVSKSSRFLTDEERLKSAYHVLYWIPSEELCFSSQWIVPLLNSIDFEDHYSVLFLCVALDRLSKLPETERLGLHSLTDLARTLFKAKNFFNIVNKTAVFPLQAPDSILGYPYNVCVTQWVRLFCNLACLRKDGALLELLVEGLIEGISGPVTSHDARSNIISLLINVIHCCTTSLDLKDDHFYRVSVRRTLEFLTRYFLQHSHPHQSNPLLLETCKTCIQFDCNELCSMVSGGNMTSQDALFALITKILVLFSEDQSLFELMLGVCTKLFVEAEGDLFLLALKTRREYLNYLVSSWPLRSPPTTTETNHVSLLLLAQTLSDPSFPPDFLSDLTRHNASSIATFPSTWIKKIKSIESMPDLIHSGLVKMSTYLEEFFVPLTCHRGSEAALLEKAPNALYLKLHLISSTALILHLISSMKTLAQDLLLWRAFYSYCFTLSLLTELLGLDALKQCLRENPGMAKRFKLLPQWMHYFGKHCSVLEPARASSLGLFVRDMLVLAVSTDTIISGLDRCIYSWMATFRLDPALTLSLRLAVVAYEEKFMAQLNVKFPLAEPAPSLPSTSVPTLGIEETFLQRLKEEASAGNSRPIRLAHQLNMAPKPTSKLGQLRQDLVREIQPVKPALPAKKKTNAAVHHTAKAVKLDVYGDALSSDVEESHCFVDTFKDGHSRAGITGVKENGRSVKLISLADVGTDTTGKGLSRQDDHVEIDPEAHIKKLHKYLLDLDIESINDRSLEGSNAKPIPDTFQSSKEYTDIFEPLLFFECRSQLLQAKTDLDSAACFSVKVLAISNVDDYHEVTVGTEGDESNRLLSEHDYIMARLYQREAKSQIVGMVTQASFKGSRSEATVRFKFKPHQHQYQVELRIGLVWKVKKLCNWVTNIREFSALHSIHDLRMSKAILKPIMAPVEEAQLADVASMLGKSLELNESQAQAIALALNNPNPFTLIQGPPGTGKTKTILGLVGALFGRPFPSLTSKLRPQRLLICAPSNAAIDEIVRRLKAGIFDCYHQKFSPKILRLGSHEMVHDDVRDLTLDATIERTFNQQCKESLALLQQQRDSIADLKSDLDYALKNGTPPDQIQKMKQNLWQQREAMKKNTGFIEGTRQSLRSKVVSEAQVVCSTLSSSGIDLLSKLQFDVVIIDEACQAVEVSSLIPLQYGCKNCILVGDPNQLPPTVISQAASIFAYEQSLFQRIQKSNPDAVQLLSVQYRMHPDISVFPNRYFYNGRLNDGPDNAQFNTRPWHQHHLLAPYRFFDIPGKERNQLRKCGDEGTSKSNVMEARSCVSLVSFICSQAPDYNFAGKIGIVTPYKEQRRTLRHEFRKRLGPEVVQHLEISTVDGYQGQEREIIIFSCVRTCESRGIGFLNDARRLNVALTRAKCSLFILGRSETLVKNSLWSHLIKDVKTRDAFISFDFKFWDRARNLSVRPESMNPAPDLTVEEKANVPEPVAFKIKTPMQRKREGTSAEPLQPSTAAIDLTDEEPPKKKPLLLDALLEKISKNNP